ncbi:MAG TPA: hypothetical protein VFW45_09540 [Candidatus Polarisedimenticolia bacterium]|nr:hypothetical protein [Candidatus Polarisedimenticolia bacterium]
MTGKGVATGKRWALPAVIALAGAWIAGAAWAEVTAQKVELRRLFPQEAEVSVESAGLARLVLPSEILKACRPDLSDLRLFDSSEHEVPYLVDAGAEVPAGFEIAQRFVPKVLEAARREERRKTGPPLHHETLEIGLPDAEPRSGSWVLVVQPRAGELVARVSVEGIDSAGRTEMLIPEASLFRLQGARPVEKLRLPLPAYHGARLRVVFESEAGSWLNPVLRLESARRYETGGKIDMPLEVLSLRSADGRTIVDLARPHGVVPDLLRIETTTRTFDRRVEIRDEGPSGAGGVGTGNVYRVEALVPVGEQEVALRPAHGERLSVTIVDGDSPALEQLAFVAVVRQPSLIFSAAAGRPGGAFGTLRFGGGRAHAPRYDLAGLLPPIGGEATGKRAEAAALLVDRSKIQTARLGGIRPNAAYDQTPALAVAMHPGASIDRRLFSHLRTITVPASAEGLSRLRLEPGDLAILGDELTDLRVADAESRQWPYLVQRDAATQLVPLAVEGPRSRDRVSRYALRLPASPLRLGRLILEPDAAFFDRSYTLEAKTADGKTTTLARGRLARAITDSDPAAIDLPPARVASLELVIQDGDDAPLRFESIQGSISVPDLYLTAPAGRYELLLGAPGKESPRYELESVRDVVLAVQAEAISAGPIEQNKELSLQARLNEKGFRPTLMLWAALGAAVLVLLFLTFRLARRESPSPE